ncbi:hypothetical protein [Trinickia sp. EG282A]|uniref:hypothetical protein n=1 Tax=Trinickia sp. EG282A TaxID=3237013 RepID=UPI0034D1937E
MQHTVIAFFDTYDAAERARDMLIAAGLTTESISLQTRCEPTYATDATTVAGKAHEDEGLLASIERFFESLFTTQPPRCETAQYAEAIRRGAVMLSVDAATDAQCQLAKTTLERTSPIDIEERASTWSAPSEQALHERSPLEELGLRRSAPKAQPGGPVRSFAHTSAEPAGRKTPAEPPRMPPKAVPDEYLQDEEEFEDKAHRNGSNRP